MADNILNRIFSQYFRFNHKLSFKSHKTQSTNTKTVPEYEAYVSEIETSLLFFYQKILRLTTTFELLMEGIDLLQLFEII